MFEIKNKNFKEKGVSLYLALVIMSIFIAMVLGLNSILIGQIKAVRSMGYSVTAFYAAETGIEEALSDPNCTTTCTGYSNKELDLGGGSKAYYSVSGLQPIWTNGCTTTAVYCLKSIGTFGQTKRAIQVSR